MKVILLQDVKSLGKKGELVEASDGYARNYLLPRKIAREANAQAMNEYIKMQKIPRISKLQLRKLRLNSRRKCLRARSL